MDRTHKLFTIYICNVAKIYIYSLNFDLHLYSHIFTGYIFHYIFVNLYFCKIR